MNVKPFILPVTLFIVIAFAIYFFYKKFIKIDLSKVVDEKEIDTNKLTYKKSQYLIFADQIQTAATGFGTDETTIYAVMGAMKNNNDVLQLIKAFGLRWFGDLSAIYYNASLAEVLTNELNKKELAQLNNILASNGITITF